MTRKQKKDRSRTLRQLAQWYKLLMGAHWRYSHPEKWARNLRYIQSDLEVLMMLEAS